MFICSNLKAGGIEYKGDDFQGEYFCCFEYNILDHTEQLKGFIVHF